MQPTIWAVQLYLHYVNELAILFHCPNADVEMKVVHGQELESHIHAPAASVELIPHERQFERLAGVQF